MAVYCLRFQTTFECQKDHFPDLTKMMPLALEQCAEKQWQSNVGNKMKRWIINPPFFISINFPTLNH